MDPSGVTSGVVTRNDLMDQIDKDEASNQQVNRDQSDPYVVAPRRLRIAETVLSKRNGRIVLVVDQLTESFNQQAMIRTAESLGKGETMPPNI